MTFLAATTDRALALSALLLMVAVCSACGGSGTTCPVGSSLDPSTGRCLAVDAGADDAATDADTGMADTGLTDASVADATLDASDGSLDGSAPDAAVDACAVQTYYADTDMDGFGDPDSTMDACDAPAGFVSDATDCDDGAMAVHPGAVEACDGVVDEDCDGTVDEDCACVSDATRPCGMSAGECRQGTQSCVAGSWAACEGAVGPVAETCNGLDDDCDGATDEELSPPDTCLHDGVCAGTSAICRAARFVCDYSGVANYQAGDESRCDGLDNDCDGTVDEGLLLTYHRDADGDGFGDPAISRQACPGAAPTGFVRNAQDCDDACPTCFTGASESCDGLDNNCNGSIDEGATTPFYADLDGDGHGAGSPVQRCSGGSGWSSVGDDCWDEAGFRMAAAAQVHPGQSAYFTTGRSDTSTFDYNCNGADEQHWTSTYTGCSTACVGEGWTSGTPVCGASGTYRRCVNAGGCSAPTETRTQECH